MQIRMRIAGLGVVALAAGVQVGGAVAASAAGYNGQGAANYAATWANGYNTANYSTLNDDCTNFVSQSLHSGGGFPYVNMPGIPGPGDSSNYDWWFNRYNFGVFVQDYESYTWGGAPNFKNFLNDTASGQSVGSYYPYNAPNTPNGWDLGDVAFYNWGDGKIDHTAIKSAYGSYGGWSGSLMSQHTKPLRNVPYDYYGVNTSGSQFNEFTTQIYLWHINGNVSG